MIKYLKSELLKWKGSYAFYLITTLSILQLTVIVPYVLLVTNPIILENIIILVMLGHTVIVAILSILIHEQEEKANEFQNIKHGKNRAAIWGMKLISTDLLLILPSLLLWLIVGFELNKVFYYLFVGGVTWLLLIFLTNFHLLLSFFVGKGGNILFSFVECLFIIFASNKTFLDVFWMPIALPVNAILLYGNEKAVAMIVVLMILCVLVFIGNIVILLKN